MPHSPSVQSIRRSPGSSSSVWKSGMCSGDPLSTLRISDLCGCSNASASVRRPESTRVCTHEWSCVRRVRTPSRSLYARESPMFTSAATSSRRTRPHTVVPMPSRAGSSSTRPARRSLARVSAPSRTWISASASTWGVRVSDQLRQRWSVDLNSSAVTADARSPAAATPMPSATTCIVGDTYAESWLFERTRPTSERAWYARVRVTSRPPSGCGRSAECQTG